MANSSEVYEILAMAAAAYPRYELKKETAKVYAKMLADIPADTLRAAVLECIVSSPWFPSIYELRNAMVELHKRTNAIPSAEEAWGELLHAPTLGESYKVTDEIDAEGRTVVWKIIHKFSHPLVEKVARDLGWPKKFWTDLLASDRAKYIQAYQSQLDRASNNALSLPEVNEYISGEIGATNEPMAKLAEGMRVK